MNFFMIYTETGFQKKFLSKSWYFNKMVLQNTLRSDVSAILKTIHVREIVRDLVWVEQ